MTLTVTLKLPPEAEVELRGTPLSLMVMPHINRRQGALPHAF
jgi:hypothetical protein